MEVAQEWLPTWAVTVAEAAPGAPHPKAKMKMGASTILRAFATMVALNGVRVSPVPLKIPYMSLSH